MQPDYRTVRQNADVQEVFNEMGKEGFRRVIVVDDFGRMAGILTKTDLMRLIQIRMASGGIRGDVAIG
jgi:predicted transcriptional regulator